MNYPKFLNNKRETFKFHFDSGIEKEGKFGLQWSFGVLWKHDDNTEEETYLYATAALNRLLEGLNPLKNRTIQIELAQDPKDLKRKYWIIYDENGAEITPKASNGAGVATQPLNAATGQISANPDKIAALNERLDNASKAFTALRNELLDEIKSLKNLMEQAGINKESIDLHTSLKNRDIHEVKTPESAAAIVNSYKDIPTINALPEGFEDK